MAEFLDLMRVWIEQIITSLGYTGIALVMLAENLFPPIPSELVMPFGGFMAAQGKLELVWVLVAGAAGALGGAVILYYLGVWGGERIFRPLVQKWGKWFLLSEEDYEQALKVFARYGGWAVLIGRLMPIVRSLISIPAGMNRMRFFQFLALTTVGTTLWNLWLAVAGYWLGSRWDEILAFTKQYERGMLIALGTLVVGFVMYKLAQRNRPQNAAE